MSTVTPLQCVVVTPERAVLDETVDFVALPMFDGELGVLPGRAPLIGRLGYGELRIRRGGTVRELYVDGGFVEIRENVVTVLTEKAVAEEDLNVTAATRELEQALEPGKSPAERAEQFGKQARARAKLRVARKVSRQSV